jgi:hypothetical protein
MYTGAISHLPPLIKMFLTLFGLVEQRIQIKYRLSNLFLFEKITPKTYLFFNTYTQVFECKTQKKNKYYFY